MEHVSLENLDSCDEVSYHIVSMKQESPVKEYYLLNKELGRTSAAMTWGELESALSSGQAQPDTAVTQQGASKWCKLSDLLACSSDTNIEQIIKSQREAGSKGILSRVMSLFKGGMKA